MNPAALKANLHRLETGGTIIVNEDAFEERNLDKAGYEQNPLDDGTLADGYRVLRVPMTSLTKERCADLGARSREMPNDLQELLRPRPRVRGCTHGRPSRRRVDRDEVRQERTRAVGQPRRAHRGLQLRRDDRGFGHRYEVRPASLPPGEYRASPATWPCRWGLVGRQAQARQAARYSRLVSDHPRESTSSTNSPSSRTSGSGPCRPKTRSPPSASRSARRSAGHLGVTTTSGPGVALKSEAIGARVGDRAPSGPRRHPARRSIHRSADQDRGLRPQHQACSVATARHRFRSSRRTVRRLLRRRDRGGADRAQVPHAGDPPLRRLPRQRLRTLAPARPTHSPTSRCPSRPSSTTPMPRATPVLAVLRDETTLARPWAIPGTPGLEHRIGGLEKERRHRQHRLRPDEPRADGRAAGREGRNRDHGRHRADRGPRRRRCRRAPRRLGLDLRRLSTPRSNERAERGRRSPICTFVHLNPLPSESGRDASPTVRSLIVPELNTGQLANVLRARYLIDVLRHCRRSRVCRSCRRDRTKLDRRRHRRVTSVKGATS